MVHAVPAKPTITDEILMGLENRTYWKDDGHSYRGGGGGGLLAGMPKPGPAVKYLLIINIVAFFLQLVFSRGSGLDLLSEYFGATPAAFWQVWRYITFQFLHDTVNLWHLGLNMLGLYMLGSHLERHWGSRGFVKFYLTCGFFAGLTYVIIGNIVGTIDHTPIVGASGGVYGILLAAAVLFPHIRLILFLFPVPIRFACLLIFVIMAWTIISAVTSGNYAPGFWSEVAHLGGAVTAAVLVLGLPKISNSSQQVKAKLNEGAWRKKMQKRADDQAQIDAILTKIHEHGLTSLSEREKKILSDATSRQRQQEKQINRDGHL